MPTQFARACVRYRWQEDRAAYAPSQHASVGCYWTGAWAVGPPGSWFVVADGPRARHFDAEDVLANYVA